MTGFTRVERILADAGIGDAIIRGLKQNTRDDKRAVAAARTLYRDMRATIGYSDAAPILTSGAAQSKLGKNLLPSYGVMLTPERGIMSPAVADIRAAFRLSGPFNLCPLASAGCAAACLVFSGQSGMPTAQRAQATRTAFLLAEPSAFGLILGAELRAAIRRHGRINLRLNTTSDIRWEVVAPDAMRALADAGVTTYDYTAWRPADRQASGTYRLTHSAKEPSHTPDDYLIGILQSGGTVAMPFDTARGHALPAMWRGYRVIDGDTSDERANDPAGVIVGLRAKGYRWRRDNSAGFIRAAADA